METMANKFEDVNNKIVELEEDINKISVDFSTFHDSLLSDTANFKKDIAELKNSPILASSEVWAKSEVNERAEIIQKVNDNLPNRMITIKDSVSQAIS